MQRTPPPIHYNGQASHFEGGQPYNYCWDGWNRNDGVYHAPPQPQIQAEASQVSSNLRFHAYDPQIPIMQDSSMGFAGPPGMTNAAPIANYAKPIAEVKTPLIVGPSGFYQFRALPRKKRTAMTNEERENKKKIQKLGGPCWDCHIHKKSVRFKMATGLSRKPLPTVR
ncbi:hypothetical protein LTS10_013140 [Elasticomyces elasticus]|nr:hypothetical protein LTS10_013140 [Elasticomyces elasticus]